MDGHEDTPGARLAIRHARIRAEVEARILSGEWKPGHRPSKETALMAQHGCSRMTVNKAMASIAATGLVTRNRRAGNTVAQPRMHPAILTVPDIRAEIEARGEVIATAR